ncbi:MAG: hypothetical protein NVS4B9_39450 [Ktedonobacteraceae bacterium]
MRHAGIKAEMSYGDRSRKAQMKQANSSGAAFAIIIGEDELASGSVSVKHMLAEGMELENKQVQVKREDLVTYLQQHEK